MNNETFTRGPIIRKPVGLGDAVASVATPIARVLGLGCVDPATGKLRPESGCGKRKAAMNAAVPNIVRPFGIR